MSRYHEDGDEARVSSRRVRFDDEEGEDLWSYDRRRSRSPVIVLSDDRRTPSSPATAPVRLDSPGHYVESTPHGWERPQSPPPPTHGAASESTFSHDDGSDESSKYYVREPQRHWGGHGHHHRNGHWGESHGRATNHASILGETRYPRRGKTRFPSSLVSKRALIDLGYPFYKEGITTVVLKALDQEGIEEVLQISKAYNGRQAAAPFAPSGSYFDDHEGHFARSRLSSPPWPGGYIPRQRLDADGNYSSSPPPPFPDGSLQWFIQRERMLQSKLTHLRRMVREADWEMQETDMEEMRRREKAKQAMAIYEEQTALEVRRNICQDQLRAQNEKAEPLSILSSRWQNLKLDEADVLLQEAKALEIANSQTEKQEDGSAVSHAKSLQYFTDRRRKIQLEADRVLQELRSAEAAKGACQELERELRDLKAGITQAQARRRALFDDAHSDNNVADGNHQPEAAWQRLSELQNRTRVAEEDLDKLQRDRFERGLTFHTPPPPVVINSNRYEEHPRQTIDIHRHDDGNSTEVRSPDGSTPIIVTSRLGNDSGSDTLSEAGPDAYEQHEMYGGSGRTYRAVERAGLSVSLPLDKGVRAVDITDGDGDDAALTSEGKAWKGDKTVLSDGVSSTELRVIHAAEYSEDETGNGKTTLMCWDGPLEHEHIRSAQMRWLHIQQPALKFKTLENIVINCAYVDSDLRRIAVEAIERVKDKFAGVSECGAYLEPGSILRYLGKRNETDGTTADGPETEPVVFLSSPFLTLQPLSSRRASKFEYRPRTLLQSLYGYDVGGERESSQVVQKLNISKSKKDMLHVNQLWSLTIGSKILITMSEQSTAQLRGDSIAIDSRNSTNKEPLVVRLTDCDNREYRMVVERDCSYVDFLIYAVARVAGQEADALQWELLDDQGEILTPSRWIEILGSRDSKMRSFAVKEKTLIHPGSEGSECKAETIAGTIRHSEARSHRSTRSSVYRGRGSANEHVHGHRRSRSEYELGSHRSASQHHSSYGAHLGSRRLVSAPTYARSSRAYSPGSQAAASHERSWHRDHSRPSASDRVGLLVPYTGRPRYPQRRSRREEKLDRRARSSNPKSSDADDNSDSSRSTSQSSGTPIVLAVDGNETGEPEFENNKSHLSDITEERSSSAPTPKIGTSSKFDDGSSSSEEGEKNEGSKAEESREHDPRNMQLIVHPKSHEMDPRASNTTGQPRSLEFNRVTIDINEPWKEMVANSLQPRNEPFVQETPTRNSKPRPTLVEHFDSVVPAASSPMSHIEKALYEAGAALDDLYEEATHARRREDFARAAEIQVNMLPGQELAVQRLLKTAVNQVDVEEIDRDYTMAVECLETVQKRHAGHEYRYYHDAPMTTASIEQELDTQQRVVRRLRLIRQALDLEELTSHESRLGTVERELERSQPPKKDADGGENFHLEAGLDLSSRPEIEDAIRSHSVGEENTDGPSRHPRQSSKSDKDGRPLGRTSVMHWAHGRGHFKFPNSKSLVGQGILLEDLVPFPPPPDVRGEIPVEVERESSVPARRRMSQRRSLSSPTESLDTSRSSHRSHKRRGKLSRMRIRGRSPSHHHRFPPSSGDFGSRPGGYYSYRPPRGSNSRCDDYDDYDYDDDSRPYDRTVRYARARSRNSYGGYGNPFSPLSPSPTISSSPLLTLSSSGSVNDLSDSETLAPGVILNELPRPRKHVPEVYDVENKSHKSARERSTARSAHSTDLRGDSISSRRRRATKNHVHEHDDILKCKSFHTEKDSDWPTQTELTRLASRDSAQKFRRFVLRRWAPSPEVDVCRIEVARGQEAVEDEEADGPFVAGRRTFYRKEPKPQPGEMVDWVDEYVIDQKQLPWHEPGIYVVRVVWPTLPDQESHKAAQVLERNFDPFLRWRVKSSDQERTPEDIDKSVLKILGSMDESLQGGNFYQLYSRTFMCTLKDLLERHEFLSLPLKDSRPAMGDAGAGGDNSGHPEPNKHQTEKSSGSAVNAPNEGPLPSDTGEIDPQQTGSTSAKLTGEELSKSPLSESKGARLTPSDSSRPGRRSSSSQYKGDGTQSQSIGTVSYDETVLKRLFDVSKDLLSAFMPAEGGPVINSVCQRFWGTVDEIMRHVIWQTTSQRRGRRPSRCVIRDFDVPSTVIGRAHQAANLKKSWLSCAQCQNGRHYDSVADAITHLHKEHFECSGRIRQPYDDPCFVWLRRLNGPTPPSVIGYGNVAHVEDFVSQLLLINGYSRELHSLVANIYGSSTTSHAQLPANVVLAFEQIMAMYMILAHRLSLNNAKETYKSQGWAIGGKIDELIWRGDLAHRQVLDHLMDAKKDIVLLRGTSRQIDSLSVEAVGAEFVVLSLMTNLQNRSILNTPTPYASGKGDYVALYQRYTSSLRFQANRRPQKRVFLDIHGLEEELDALQGMLKAQKSLLCNYLKLLSPGSTRATNATRVGQYNIERAYGRKQQKNLDAKEKSIKVLKDKSGVLKEQVRKTIEILEEDHGKAIRVFTFVTLLFLPLSFVTSFMGMNTTDIRDTEWSQRIFWATGVPVTLAVVILALIYAYRGEVIQDWVLTNSRANRRHVGRGMGGSFAWSGEPPQDGDTFLTTGAHKKKGVIRVDSGALLRARRQRGSVGEPEWMRDARERLWAKHKSRSAPAAVRRRITGDGLAG